MVTGLEDRLWGEVDGTLGPLERLRLRCELGLRPELRARLAELRTLDERLADLREVEPPPELLEQVMARIAGRSPANRPTPEVSATARGMGGRRAWAERATALAAGLLLGILGTALLLLGPTLPPGERYGGSMAESRAGGLVLPLGAAPGHVAVGRSGARLVLVVDNPSAAMIDVVLESTDPAAPAASGPLVALRLGARRWDGEVEVAAGAWPLRLVVAADGMPTVERVLRCDQVPEISASAPTSAAPAGSSPRSSDQREWRATGR